MVFKSIDEIWMQPMHWFVYIFVAGSDNIINLKVNGQIPQKSNLSYVLCLRYWF